MSFGQALRSFLQWVQRCHAMRQKAAVDDQPAIPNSQAACGTNSNADIVLVAHYGAGFAHEILVRGLEQHGLLAAARHMQLCDSLILFKSLPQYQQNAKLPYLASKLCPAYEPREGYALDHAEALREVSRAAFKTPEVFWYCSACSLQDFGARIGVHVPSAEQAQQQPGHVSSAVAAACSASAAGDCEGGIAPLKQEAHMIPSPQVPPAVTAAAAAGISPAECLPIKQEVTAKTRARSLEDADDACEDVPARKRPLGTFAPAPERLGPTTPPPVARRAQHVDGSATSNVIPSQVKSWNGSSQTQQAGDTLHPAQMLLTSCLAAWAGASTHAGPAGAVV